MQPSHRKRSRNNKKSSHQTKHAKKPRGRAIPHVEFSTLRYGTQTSVLKKLNFKDFIAFQKSSQFAVTLCEKNQKLKFPFEIEDLAVSEDDTVCLNNDDKDRPFTEIDKQVVFTIRSCADFNARPFSEERSNFYAEKIKEIRFLRCCPIENYDPLLEKMLTTVPIHFIAMEWGDFYYDTSKISRVNLLHNGMTPEKAFDIKAEDQLIVCFAAITPNDVVQHIKDLMSSPKFPKKTFLVRNQFNAQELKAVLEEFGDKAIYTFDQTKQSHTWAIARHGETEPFLDLTYEMNEIRLANRK